MSGCRIGKVRLKGAATILPFRQTERDYLQDCLIRNAAQIANFFAAGEMDGYVILGWDKNGVYTKGCRLPFEGAIGLTMFPSWIADVMRRDLIASGNWT